MMKRFDPRIVFGFLLLIGGGLALLQAMGYLQDASDIFWSSIFVLLGLLFLSLLFGGHWWSLFPGFTLLAIGVLIVLPEELDDFGGLIFLGGIALAFWVTYLTAPQERWWALIPAGVLTTLSAITVISDRFDGFETGGFLFVGLSITFLLVALLAGMRWAFWPAAVLGIMGALSLASLFEIANYIWSAALIAAGGFLLFRYFAQR
jgi:hypothetical protein